MIGSWPASVSGKWLHTIAIRNKVHDGAKMTGKSYRVPIHPVVLCVDPPDSNFKIIESIPVKSVITFPKKCTACHSSKLILQSHFDQEKWIKRIRWMQRTQKLWDLGDTEKPILAYLTKYYG
ncbi:hypothetical protein [Spirosoma flavum]|uniref:Uncharacterized protein n=1 Tax=Spirosoma flavum TaxID=2048557 RepID=A0ABW6AEJ0_9BACT